MKDRIYRLINPIQDYAWGSKTAIPELLGQPQRGQPQAEMWMGAHPKAPSRVEWQGTALTLDRFIKLDPAGILGPSVADRYDGALPFLFKVLAAAEPLSIQAHPNRTQARRGYQAETRLGVPFDAPHRNYKDPHHKPECLSALTPFWALCGFRPTDRIIAYGDQLDLPRLAAVLSGLKRRPGAEGRRGFLGDLMRMPAESKAALLRDLQDRLPAMPSADPVFEWLQRLLTYYPHDIGVLAPIYLNLFCLQPGQAVFLSAGVLHAYLEGVGIELMANSDNVLRGGLTPKHIDETELFRVADFEARRPLVLAAPEAGAVEHVYACPAEEFSLALWRVAERQPRHSGPRGSVEIVLCTQGQGHLHTAANGQREAFRQGDSFLIPAGVDAYTIEGQGTFYKATVPHRQ